MKMAGPSHCCGAGTFAAPDCAAGNVRERADSGPGVAHYEGPSPPVAVRITGDLLARPHPIGQAMA